MPTKKTVKSSKKVVVGAAGAAIAVATAGAAAGYYFYGTAKAKKHRQAASAWAKGLKTDVTKKAKALKKIDAASVAKIVDQASKQYHSVKGASLADIQHAAKELKANWKKMQAELAPSAAMKKAVQSASPKAIKKSVKKVVRKEAKNITKTVKRIAKRT